MLKLARAERNRPLPAGFEIKLPKIGTVNMTEALRFSGKIMSATVSTKAGRWWVSVLVEFVHNPPENNGRRIGVDVGIKSLAVTSEGEVFENQEALRSELPNLKRMNQHLSRKVLFSKNWHKCKAKIQKMHMDVRNKRIDATHKATTKLAKESSAIFVEDLNVAGMVRNHKLALSLSDASMSEFHRQLEYKAEQFGGFVGKVGRFFASSKTCNECGTINKDLTLSDRVWTCECGSVNDRDINAAKNIRDQGMRLHLA